MGAGPAQRERRRLMADPPTEGVRLQATRPVGPISQVGRTEGRQAHSWSGACRFFFGVGIVRIGVTLGLRTPLYDQHVALGAHMVDFGGWDMPVNYGSQIEEHHAVTDILL